jgi:ribonuclease PH
VLNDYGCNRPTRVTAATLALVQAGIELNDVVTACIVSVFQSENNATLLLAYLTLDKINHSYFIVVLAVMPNGMSHPCATLQPNSGIA